MVTSKGNGSDDVNLVHCLAIGTNDQVVVNHHFGKLRSVVDASFVSLFVSVYDVAASFKAGIDAGLEAV